MVRLLTVSGLDVLFEPGRGNAVFGQSGENAGLLPAAHVRIARPVGHGMAAAVLDVFGVAIGGGFEASLVGIADILK